MYRSAIDPPTGPPTTLGRTNIIPTVPAMTPDQPRITSPNGTMNWLAANVAPSKPTNASPIAHTPRNRSAAGSNGLGPAGRGPGAPAARGMAKTARTVRAPRPIPPSASAARQSTIGTSTAVPISAIAAPALNAEENAPTGTPR